MLYITVFAVEFSETVSLASEVPSSIVIVCFAVHALYLLFPSKLTVTVYFPAFSPLMVRYPLPF